MIDLRTNSGDSSLLGFSITPQVLAQMMYNLRNLYVAGRLLPLIQFRGMTAYFQKYQPISRQLDSARLFIKQLLKHLRHPRIGLDHDLIPSPGPTDTADAYG